MTKAPECPVTAVRARPYRIPADAPESDGTFEWSSTTMVLVEIDAGGQTGIGYTYCHEAACTLIETALAQVLSGKEAFAIRECWHLMIAACRNMGRQGIAACAISACDVALHDLVGKLLDAPTWRLLGARRKEVMPYGSGGFTSYDRQQLTSQLAGWAHQGLKAVKMKIGREPERDLSRVAEARSAIGPSVGLMVDANGAYSRKQALALASSFAEQGVIWFEEPVSSDDLEGLHLIRNRAPAGMDISAGEYGFDDFTLRRMIDAGAVDVLQVDATRCLGYTGYLIVDGLAHAANLPLSSHCAPALSLPVALAALQQRHVEWFHDHVRIESLLLDGAPLPKDGMLAADLTRPGIGLAFKEADAARYVIRTS